MGCCQSASGLTVSSLAAILGAMGTIMTALILFLGFRKSNRTKAAEIYYNLELNFKEHIPILLDIEYAKDYKNKIKTAIRNVKNQCTTKKDDKVIIQLDRMFRHFNTCYQIKKLEIDNGKIDGAYRYYLDLFAKRKRHKLRKYIKNYWKSVDAWITEHEAKRSKKKIS